MGVEDSAMDIFGSPDSGQKTHLMPNSVARASTWVHAARGILGLDREADMEVLQKAIHGAKKEFMPDAKMEAFPDAKKQAVPQSATIRRRVKKTGIRHNIVNKIRLTNQAKHFDERPNVLIIPILSLAEAKKWNGDAYNAIVLTRGEASLVPQEILMTVPNRLNADPATLEEVTTSRNLLVAVLKGLASSLSFSAPVPPEGANERDKAECKSLWEKFTTQLVEMEKKIGENQIPVPPENFSIPEGKVVCKVQFVDCDDAVGHKAPDPLLLAVKSAVNWGRPFELDLVAAGSEFVDEVMSDMSILAEELDRDRCEQGRRNTSRDELACALGQTITMFPMKFSPDPRPHMVQNG